MGKWDSYKTYSSSGGVARHSRDLASDEKRRHFPAETVEPTITVVPPDKITKKSPEYRVRLGKDVAALVAFAHKGQKIPFDLAKALDDDQDRQREAASIAQATIGNYKLSQNQRFEIADCFMSLKSTIHGIVALGPESVSEAEPAAESSG